MITFFYMTVKIVEKKLRDLEYRLKAVELGLWSRRRLKIHSMSSVWEKTYGKMSKTKAGSMLRAIKRDRATSNR